MKTHALVKHLIPSFPLILIVLLFQYVSSTACTTGVVSGRFTANGRPMIWKVRDTDFLENAVRRYVVGNMEYVGLVNANDTTGSQIWGGHNSFGFAIMNSASFNVNEGYQGTWVDREGFFMHEALRTCATLGDFERLLNDRPSPKGLAAHFGVIDAQGGAAFYEVNNETWVKYDANDPIQAPRGYVLRTNYSETGVKGKGIGFIRRQTAEQLFAGVPEGQLTIPLVLQNFSRSLYHPLLEVDYRQEGLLQPFSQRFVATDDMICRYGTASTILVEGVRQGEDPKETTSWIQVGLPFVSVSLPVFVGHSLPTLLTSAQPGRIPPLSQACMSLRKLVYPLGDRSDGYHYLKIQYLFNNEGTGITQRIEALEQDIFRMVEQERGRNIPRLYEIIEEKVRTCYTTFSEIEL